MRFVTLVCSAVFTAMASAYTPAAVALRPSEWLGIDGNWSTVSFQLGSNSQEVNVLVSTTLSEFWAIGPGGCLPKEPHCSAARGGVFTPKTSKTWSKLGTWQLGLEYLGYGGNGEYGQDSLLITHSLVTDSALSMSKVLIAAINTTDYLNGLFGLGITQGSFGGKVVESPLSQTVMKAGWIPSYSYGYTAGASYRNSPVSLTLGGFEDGRFVDHEVDFTLSSGDNLPRSLVRGVEVNTDESKTKPDHWNSTTEILSDFSNSFEALIDSTTPYLWLPDEICDRFEAALNLTYNSTFDLYILTNDQYREFMKEDSYSFTFSLSSFDNTDDFGEPLDAYGVVNITIPARALTSTLSYPFQNEAIKYGDPAIPYFALRRTLNTSTLILGRSFLQESYIITKYDSATFSLHQALFPDNSAETNLTAIDQPDNAAFPGPPSSGGSGLSTGAKAGIAVGVILGCFIAGLIGWLCYRRRQKKKNGAPGNSPDEAQDSAAPTNQSSPASRLLSLLGRRKKSPQTETICEKDAGLPPSEAPNTQIYELPVPMAPVELDGDDASSLNGDTLGTEGTQNMSAYELARRKMERQLQGPAPAYSPPAEGVIVPGEKSEPITTTTQVVTPRVQTQPPSPPSSPSVTDSGTAVTGSLGPSLPSPITPRMDWMSRMGDPPSPLTSTHVGSSTQQSGPSLRPLSSMSDTCASVTSSHLGSDNDHFVEAAPLSVPMGQATVQRTPIDPSRVVLLGPLPDNVRLSRNTGLPNSNTNSGATPADLEVPRGHNTTDSLGSNFTVDEELRMELTRQAEQSSAQSTNQQQQTRLPQVQTQGPNIQRSSPADGTEPNTPDSQGRINPGTELVHVPQLAEKRYSWEEER